MKKLTFTVAAMLLALGASQSALAVGIDQLPDGGPSACLLAIGLAGLGAIARKLK